MTRRENFLVHVFLSSNLAIESPEHILTFAMNAEVWPSTHALPIRGRVGGGPAKEKSPEHTF